jgi:2-polyprenyl-3-methyl-5-hydroxy-6-metoxy-1,4-benzoquinol methylase
VSRVLRSGPAALDPAWPEAELESVEACPVCGNKGREPLYSGLRDRVFFSAPGSWALYRCSGCDSTYLDPRPTEAAIGRAYAGYYTHAGGGEPAAPLGRRLPRVRRALANGYLRSRFGCRLTPSWGIGRWIAPLVPYRRRLLDFEVRHLRLPRPGARLLDVGCGNGSFIGYSRLLGWDAEGIDPDPLAVRSAQEAGLPVRRAVLREGLFPDASFDAITMNHVIEHIHDPVRALEVCAHLLRPRGQLWIATPNLDSSGHHFFGADWRGLEPPRHLVLSTASSLSLALTRAGFSELIELSPPPTATYFFAASAAIRAGADPMRPFPTPRTIRIRARFADARAFADSGSSEELMVRATKP